MTVKGSDRDPELTCNAGDCDAWATKQSDRKACDKHGGKSTGPKSEEGKEKSSMNAVSHGLYADANNFYNTVMNDKQRRLCDQIFQDYCTQFREYNGEPHTGEQSRLFEIAVNHIKVIHSDNWAVDKPEELESGNPMVDKGERYNTEGVPYQEYSETVVLQGQQKLRSEDRQWLKDYGLLNDPQSQKADAMGDITELWAEDLE